MIRQFALLAGLLCLAVGFLGFIPAAVWPVQGTAGGLLLGLLPASAILNATYIVAGVAGLYASGRYRMSVTYARGLCGLLAALAILALLPQTALVPGLAPLTHDPAWTPGLLAMICAYFAWGEPSRAYIRLL